jgi:hypothetical protein
MRDWPTAEKRLAGSAVAVMTQRCRTKLRRAPLVPA